MQLIIGFQNASESAQITLARFALSNMTGHRLACIAVIILVAQTNLLGGTVTMPSRTVMGVTRRCQQTHTIFRDGLNKSSVKAGMDYWSSAKTIQIRQSSSLKTIKLG